MNFKMKILLACLAVLQLSSCTKEKIVEKVVEPKIIDLKNEKSDEDLVRSAEQLIDLNNFPIADKMLELALKINPQNRKAQFLKAILKPSMKFKGILKRIDPLVANEGLQEKLKSFLGSINYWSTSHQESPDSTLKSFLLDGKPDIDNYEKFQDWVVEVRTAYNEMREFMKANLDLSVTLNLNPYVWRGMIEERMKNSCYVMKQGEDKLTIQCDQKDILKVTVSSADMIALQQLAGGSFLYLGIYTSYSAKNAEQTSRYKGRRLDQKAFEHIKSIPGLAEIRADHVFSSMKALGADFLEASRWADKNYSYFCSEGKPRSHQGALFENGFCFTDVLNATLANLNTSLSGPFNVVIGDPDRDEGSNATKEIAVDATVMMNRPIADLKKHLPTKLNECGRATQFADGTFEGLLPKGNFHDVIGQKCR